MTGVLAHALPRVCEIVGAAAGGHEEVDKTETREKKEEREAASHALELVHERKEKSMWVLVQWQTYRILDYISAHL